MTVCFLILATARPTLINWNNWFGFILSGFYISIIISEITYVLHYRNSFPSYLLPIEEVLSKDCTGEQESKPSFFRQEGFLWIDFKEGVITERIETMEILRRLKTEKSVMLVGDQASGKSNILRNVGYELANNGFIVFFINAGSLDVNLVYSEIKKWDMSNVVLIIDDVHRNINKTSDFIDRVHSNNIKVVLSSRPANFNILKEKSGQRLLSVIDRSVEVKTTKGIIRAIVLKYIHANDEKINVNSDMINEIIQKCGTDLWLLTYFLLAWDVKKCKDISKIDILKEIYESRIGHLEIKDKDALIALETVCVLYQFEIPYSETYLVEMGLNKYAIDLVSEGFLIKKGTYYYVHHASVAKIYLDTLERYQLVNDLTNLSIIILLSYLEKNKQDQGEVFYKLSIFPKSIEKKETILKAMFQQLRVEDIVSQVRKEESLEKIGIFFQSVSSIDKNYAKEILRSFSLEELLNKLICQPSVRQQKNLILDISLIDEEIARKLSEKRPKVALVIPAFNEEKLISSIQEVFDFVDDVVVIDDGSTDDTNKIATKMGARVIRHKRFMGFFTSVQTGLIETLNLKADIVILDSSFFVKPPWMNRIYIPNMIRPIMKHDADLAVGHFGSQLDRYATKSVYVQAMNPKGVEKFLKYFSFFCNGQYSLHETDFLFSKILRVETINLFNGKTLGTNLKVEKIQIKNFNSLVYIYYNLFTRIRFFNRKLSRTNFYETSTS